MSNRNYTRTSLSTNQHILHLLLSVFTFGLWIPVWIILSAIGNRVYPDQDNGQPYIARPGMAAPPPGYGGTPRRSAHAGAAPDLPYAPPRWPGEPIPGSWADRQQRGQEREPQR